MPITVAIVDDNRGVRESFAALLNRTPGFHCAGIYATGEEAVVGLPRLNPDVALVDVHLPGMNGVECVARLKGLLPALRVLMISLYERSDVAFDSIRVGASGYLLKSAPAAQVVETIAQVHSGGAPMSMQIARKVADHFREKAMELEAVEDLNAHEQEVLELLARGYYCLEIAQILGLSTDTVPVHLHSIYNKLHARSHPAVVARFPR